jgi:hypothetical protein
MVKKTLNEEITEPDYLSLNFENILTSRQTTFCPSTTVKLPVGMNI